MNILIFGPNGSGKGTQGAVVQKKYGLPHIETGVIFRKTLRKERNSVKRQRTSSTEANSFPMHHRPHDPEPPPGSRTARTAGSSTDSPATSPRRRRLERPSRRPG